MKTFLKRTLFILLLAIAMPFNGRSQGDPDPDVIPFDGGLSLLVAAGIAYGAKKLHHHKKNKAGENNNG